MDEMGEVSQTTLHGPLRGAIRDAVLAGGRTQVDVARAASVHPTTLSLYLNGHIDAKGSTIERLMAVLDLRIAAPWTGDDGRDSTATRNSS